MVTAYSVYNIHSISLGQVSGLSTTMHTWWGITNVTTATTNIQYGPTGLTLRYMRSSTATCCPYNCHHLRFSILFASSFAMEAKFSAPSLSSSVFLLSLCRNWEEHFQRKLDNKVEALKSEDTSMGTGGLWQTIVGWKS